MPKAYITNMSVQDRWGQGMSSEITMRLDGYIPSKELMLTGFDLDDIAPGKVVVKCAYCGHYAARKTACVHCGAPVD